MGAGSSAQAPQDLGPDYVTFEIRQPSKEDAPLKKGKAFLIKHADSICYVATYKSLAGNCTAAKTVSLEKVLDSLGSRTPCIAFNRGKGRDNFVHDQHGQQILYVRNGSSLKYGTPHGFYRWQTAGRSRHGDGAFLKLAEMQGERSAEKRSTLASLHYSRAAGVVAMLHIRADIASLPEEAERIALLAVVMILQDIRAREHAASSGRTGHVGPASGGAAAGFTSASHRHQRTYG